VRKGGGRTQGDRCRGQAVPETLRPTARQESPWLSSQDEQALCMACPQLTTQDSFLQPVSDHGGTESRPHWCTALSHLVPVLPTPPRPARRVQVVGCGKSSSTEFKFWSILPSQAVTLGKSLNLLSTDSLLYEIR
jgi:hypothetical protein